jgi:hypothetical protein
MHPSDDLLHYNDIAYFTPFARDIITTTVLWGRVVLACIIVTITQEPQIVFLVSFFYLFEWKL